jgi:serine/threonine protein kinase
MGKAHRNSLKPGHKLLWYEIKNILGQGGFGITYLARDLNLNRDVAIKEYLPIEIAVRDGDSSVHPVSEDYSEKYQWGLDRFISEARTLAKFRHPNIVRVHSVFEDHNSGYMVMQYEHGHSLQDKLQGGKTLDVQELQKIVTPLLGGLKQIHAMGFIHRDIKPDNIYIRRDGSPVLLDFGSARQAMGEKTKTLTSLVTPGYAPFEQYYSRSDEQGPFTDIYGLGATLYRAVTGKDPIDAIERGKSILTTSKDAIVDASVIAKGNYSERLLNAIDHAIQFKAEERPQTIEEWQKEFEIPTKPTSNNIQSESVTEIHKIEKANVGLSDAQKHSPKKTSTAKTNVAEQPSLKPGTGEVSKRAPSVPPKEASAPKHSDDNLNLNFDRARLTMPLIYIIILGIGGYVGWQWYTEENPAQISEERPERIKQEQLAAEREAAESIRQDAAKAQDKHIEKLLQGAESDMTENRLTSPVGNNAYDKYSKVLELNSGNEEAIAGIEKLLDTYLSLFKDTLEKQQLDEAAVYIERIRAIHPDSTRLTEAKQQLTEATDKAEVARMQAETERARRKAEEERIVEMERKRKEEATAQKTLSMSKKVYDKLTEAQDLIAAKQYDQGLVALRSLEREDKLTPYEKAQLYNSFAFTYFTLEKHQDAIRSYEKVLKQPALPEALIARTLYALAQIYYSTEDYKKSLQPLKKTYKMIKDRGDQPKENLLLLMRANYYKLGDHKNLVNVLKKMVVLYPKTEYWLSLGGAYSELGQHDKQISIMEMLYKRGDLPEGSQQVNLASLYLLNDAPSQALEVLKKGMSEGTIERTTINQFLLSKAQKLAQDIELDSSANLDALRESQSGELTPKMDDF